MAKKLKQEKESVKMLNKNIKHEEYIDVLFQDVFKISLSCFHDRRYIIDDCIYTFIPEVNKTR